MTVVECSNQDRGAVGSSLTGVTASCPRARHINHGLVLVQPRKTGPCITERLLMGHNQIKQKKTVKDAYMLPFIDENVVSFCLICFLAPLSTIFQ